MNIIPSFPAPDLVSLETALEALRTVAPGFQVDIVSKAFADNVSWPETEPSPLAALPALSVWSTEYQLEIDLMVEQPGRYFAPLAKLGINHVVAHITEATEVAAILRDAKVCGLQISLALTIDVPLEYVVPYIKNGELRAVQLMGIAKVGQQGQPFDERVLPRIRELRTLYPELSITIDGAVNEDTLLLLYAAGADRFAPGSAIVGAPDPVTAYKHLVSLLRD